MFFENFLCFELKRHLPKSLRNSITQYNFWTKYSVLSKCAVVLLFTELDLDQSLQTTIRSGKWRRSGNCLNRLLFLHIFGLSGQRMWDFQAFSYFLCGTVTISILRYCYHKVFRTCEPLLMLGNNRYGYSLTPSSQRKSLDRMNSCRAELNSPILAFNSVLLSFWTPLQWIYFGEHLILSLHLKWSVSAE